MKRNMIVFMDFDQTLFDHVAMIDWIDEVAAKDFGVPASAFRDSLWQHHEYLPEGLRLYQHIDHTEKALGKSWAYVSGELDKRIKEQDLDFCYPDAHAAIEELLQSGLDVRVLTFGHGDYQRFKMNTCSFLRQIHLPVHVVDSTKRQFIAQEYQGVSGVLVDDKFPQNLPKGWLHIWIKRNQALKAPRKLKTGEVQISTLQQLSAVLKMFA